MVAIEYVIKATIPTEDASFAGENLRRSVVCDRKDSLSDGHHRTSPWIQMAPVTSPLDPQRWSMVALKDVIKETISE